MANSSRSLKKNGLRGKLYAMRIIEDPSVSGNWDISILLLPGHFYLALTGFCLGNATNLKKILPTLKKGSLGIALHL